MSSTRAIHLTSEFVQFPCFVLKTSRVSLTPRRLVDDDETIFFFSSSLLVFQKNAQIDIAHTTHQQISAQRLFLMMCFSNVICHTTYSMMKPKNSTEKILSSKSTSLLFQMRGTKFYRSARVSSFFFLVRLSLAADSREWLEKTFFPSEESNY